jgi:signal transduction histidine kinase
LRQAGRSALVATKLDWAKNRPAVLVYHSMETARQTRASAAFFGIFCAVVAAGLLAVFYSSELRQRVEDKLFDVRVRTAPRIQSPGPVVMVSVGSPKESLSQVVQATLASGPTTVVVLLSPQVWGPDSPEMDTLAALAQQDPRLIIATIGIGDDLALLPPRLLDVPREQLASGDVPRVFRRSVVRSMSASRGLLPNISDVVARRGGINVEHRGTDFTLNWLHPSQFVTVSASELLDQRLDARLEHKIALIGPTFYKPLTLVHREATFINTPWQADGDDLEDGFPLIHLHATAVANTMEGQWLRQTPLVANVMQTVVISLTALAVWPLGAGIASFLIIAGWGVLILIHSVLMARGSFIPLADTAIFSALAIVLGGLWRLRVEGRLRASYEAHAAAQKQIAQIQDRFLNRFATELASLNGRIRDLLARCEHLGAGTGSIQKVYAKAVASCDELTEYLRGIQQFASVRGHAEPKLQPTDPLEIVTKVLQQFDSRRAESRINIQVSAEETSAGSKRILALADPTLLEQILFNLVSNAIKYSPPGGDVHIRVSRKPRGRVSVAVTDKGPGIPPEFHERIFEKFYRVKDDHVYKVKGHGLGLYLSRFFASRMNALVLVESQPGQGSTFALEMAESLGAGDQT